MNKMTQIIKELNPHAMLLPDMFDKALIGTAQFCGRSYVAAYSSDKCIQILIKRQKMDELEAFEYFEQTVVNGNPNPMKPVFVNDFRKIHTLPEGIEKGIGADTGTIDELPNFPNL